MTAFTVVLAIVAVVVGWTVLAVLAASVWVLLATRCRRRTTRNGGEL